MEFQQRTGCLGNLGRMRFRADASVPEKMRFIGIVRRCKVVKIIVVQFRNVG